MRRQVQSVWREVSALRGAPGSIHRRNRRRSCRRAVRGLPAQTLKVWRSFHGPET